MAFLAEFGYKSEGVSSSWGGGGGGEHLSGGWKRLDYSVDNLGLCPVSFFLSVFVNYGKGVDTR